MSSEKLERALADAYARSVKIIREVNTALGIEAHDNAITVSASNLTPILLEIDLDED